MAQLGSSCGMAENSVTVCGNENECSMARARSNLACASALHEVLNMTLPNSRSRWARVSSCAAAADENANKDATTGTMRVDFMPNPPQVAGGQCTPDRREKIQKYSSGNSKSYAASWKTCLREGRFCWRRKKHSAAIAFSA